MNKYDLITIPASQADGVLRTLGTIALFGVVLGSLIWFIGIGLYIIRMGITKEKL